MDVVAVIVAVHKTINTHCPLVELYMGPELTTSILDAVVGNNVKIPFHARHGICVETSFLV